ncbi:hypothetical protein [Pseudactinotalea sp. HY158]|uniref:hypothetical protein n=1 Tax=Pseudactinotalea sp. HY158 TaxID=2654547 RepID=UPI00129C6FE8|nr:hypothetical protein [Pseudactinotalea sp. HY158]QGH68757.1 hypothetical protein GCE65_04020 [Pseudactinotalea sp. HY158]
MVDPTAPAIETELAHLRAALLSGRGPGASPAEIAAHTRDRPWLPGVPTERALGRVACRAARARAGARSGSAGTPGRLLDGALTGVATVVAVVFLLRSMRRGRGDARRGGHR